MTCRNFRYDLLRGGAGNGSPTSDHRRTSFETAAPVFDRKVPRAGCTRNNRILSLPPFEHGIAPSRYGGIAPSIDGERPALMLWWFRRPIRAVPCSARPRERQYSRTSSPDRSQSRLLDNARRSEEPTYEIQSLRRTSYAVFCLKNKNPTTQSI